MSLTADVFGCQRSGELRLPARPANPVRTQDAVDDERGEDPAIADDREDAAFFRYATALGDATGPGIGAPRSRIRLPVAVAHEGPRGFERVVS